MVTDAARIRAALRYQRQFDRLVRGGLRLRQDLRALAQPIQHRGHPLGHAKRTQSEHRFVHVAGLVDRHVERLPCGVQPVGDGSKADQDRIDARHAPRRLPRAIKNRRSLEVGHRRPQDR
jgi:hypothetical protein